MSIFSPNINKGAYQGELTCPFVINMVECKSKAIRFVEYVSQFRIRYRCRKCGHTFQYDISNRDDLNPYASYQKGSIWRDIQRIAQGRQLKGGFK